MATRGGTDGASAARTRGGAPTREWHSVGLVPVTLVSGGEGLLADRAAARIRDLALEEDAGTEVTRIEGAAYERDQLTILASPSLFGEPRLIFVDAMESGTDAMFTDAVAYAGSPQPDVRIVFRYGTGQRGKKYLEAIRSAADQIASCEPVTREQDKIAFVSSEFRRVGRRIDASAVAALVAAVGSDLRELANASSQLLEDTAVGHEVVSDDVERYYGGRVNATGFKVADAAAEGHRDEALVLLRQAIATGVDPVPLVAALASKFRVLAKVHGAGRGADARTLGLAPWMFRRAQSELRGWSGQAIGASIQAIAQADADVKGASRDPVYAIERALISIEHARGDRKRADPLR